MSLYRERKVGSWVIDRAFRGVGRIKKATGSDLQRRAQDAICGGELPNPEPHESDYNSHRLCIHAEGPVFDLQVNVTDLEWFRWIFDALDGKTTSWLSRRGVPREAPE